MVKCHVCGADTAPIHRLVPVCPACEDARTNRDALRDRAMLAKADFDRLARECDQPVSASLDRLKRAAFERYQRLMDAYTQAVSR